MNRPEPIRPPSAQFEELAESLGQQSYEAKAVPMSPDRSGRTAQVYRPQPQPSAQQPVAPTQAYDQASLHRQEPAPSLARFKTPTTISTVFDFLKNWAIACMAFAVLFLAPQASPPNVGQMLESIANPVILWPIFLTLFVVFARNRVIPWFRAMVEEAQGILTDDNPQLKTLISWVLGYVFVQFFLG